MGQFGFEILDVFTYLLFSEISKGLKMCFLSRTLSEVFLMHAFS